MVYVVAPLTARQRAAWDQHFSVEGAERDRRIEEGLWRRTQEFENCTTSGWTNPEDRRRRILHYRFEFDAVDNDSEHGALAVVDTYLYYSIALPHDELSRQSAQLREALAAGGWVAQEGPGETYTFDHLVAQLDEYEVHPRGVDLARPLPASYRSLDLTISSSAVPEARSALPWDVLAGGMRVPDTRGEPEIVDDVARILEHAPFQVEVGCGLSVEAGIPALHFLHELYRVTRRSDKSFIFEPEDDDVLAAFLRDPAERTVAHSQMYLACLEATGASCHESLAQLARDGIVIGDVVTNNFDGLVARAGLSERYVRRYDEQVPAVDFHPDARALLVIGSHADRRKVQARARALGLTIIYLDLEGFWEDGAFHDYPLEGPQDGDLLWRVSASEGLAALVEASRAVVVEQR